MLSPPYLNTLLILKMVGIVSRPKSKEKKRNLTLHTYATRLSHEDVADRFE